MDWQASVEAAFARERAAGRMTRQEAAVLHRQLDRLAFNMTCAPQTEAIPKAVATTWLLHTHRRQLRHPPTAPPGEQAEAARCWDWAVAAAWLRESEQGIAFTEPALQQYFCLHYCQTHPLDVWLLRRAARVSFHLIWRRWAEYDHTLKEQLLGMLRSTAPAQARAGAALVLGYIGNLAAVEEVIVALGDASDAVCLRASQALLLLGDRRAVEPLTALLRHQAYSVRIQTVRLLEAFGDPRAVEPLLGLFNDPVREVRFRAAQAIERLADMRPVDEVIAALTAAPADVPLTSTWMAQALEDGLVSRLLFARLMGQRDAVSLPVIEALGRCDAPAAPVLTGMIGQPFNLEIIIVTTRALGATGSPQAFEPLARLAYSPHTPLARQAIQALRRLGNRPALEALQRLHRHQTRWFYLPHRWLGEDIDAAIAELSEHLQQGEEDTR